MTYYRHGFPIYLARQIHRCGCFEADAISVPNHGSIGQSSFTSEKAEDNKALAVNAP